MRVLFITGRFGKKAAANGICIENIIQNFNKDDEVYVACYEDLEAISNSKIYRVKRSLLDQLTYKYEKNEKVLKILNNIKKVTNLFFLPCWPHTDPFYTRRLYKVVNKVVVDKKIDTIVAVHMPLSSLIVASKIKNKCPDIKYVAYFLDSLSGGTPLKIMSRKWNFKKKSKWEVKLLRNADKIIAMNSSKSHHDKYNRDKEFYNRITYLDVPLYKEKDKNVSSKYFSNHLINISFCGTANYPLRNMPFIMKVIQCIKDEKICFHFFGNSNYDELVNNNEKNVVYHSHVEHKIIPEILNSSDFLLNLGTVETSTISGKIFEYMSYAKPIISTYSIENEPCIPYIKDYGYYILLNENNDPKKEAERLVKYIYENKNLKINMKNIEKKLSENSPALFIERIKK